MGSSFPVESTGNPLVDAALSHIREHNEARFREIEETLIVQAHLEKRWSEHIREHAEWLQEHQANIKRHEEWLQKHEAAMKRHDEVMSEIEDRLNALIDIVRGRPQ